MIYKHFTEPIFYFRIGFLSQKSVLGKEMVYYNIIMMFTICPSVIYIGAAVCISVICYLIGSTGIGGQVIPECGCPCG